MNGNSESSPPIQRSNSTMSRNTLVRRISRRRDPSVGSYTSCADSAVSSDTAGSFEPTSFDVYDTGINSRASQAPSLSSSESMVATLPREVYVLYPHIMVTPEVSSLDAGLSILWVAIHITGVLQIAEGSSTRCPEVKTFLTDAPNAGLSGRLFKCSIYPMTNITADPTSYGKLHSMRIDLHPGQGCTVLEIIGNLHESKTIRAGETELILAKIRVAKVKLPREGSEDSTEGMIADLQNHLGDIISAYLTVRLTYKHSAFPNHKPLEPLDGMKHRISRIETEATATIKRRNPDSAWSPRTSQTMSHPLEAGPVVRLVEKHFSPEKAEEVRRRLIHDRSPISIARKFGYWAEASPEVAFGVTYQNDGMGFGIDSAVDSLRTSKSKRSLRKSVIVRPPDLSSIHAFNDGASFNLPEDMDPARKIWSEMRLTSRGGRHRHNRVSLSANHYFAMEENKFSTQANSDENNPPRAKENTKGNPIPIGDVTNERERILEVALKNKRSVGAETLRSMAPSVSGQGGRGDGRSKNGSATGLGLGVGRAWGWTAPWW